MPFSEEEMLSILNAKLDECNRKLDAAQSDRDEYQSNMIPKNLSKLKECFEGMNTMRIVPSLEARLTNIRATAADTLSWIRVYHSRREEILQLKAKIEAYVDILDHKKED